MKVIYNSDNKHEIVPIIKSQDIMASKTKEKTDTIMFKDDWSEHIISSEDHFSENIAIGGINEILEDGPAISENLAEDLAQEDDGSTPPETKEQSKRRNGGFICF